MTSAPPWDGQLYSDGWRPGSGATITVTEPATGATLATVAEAGATDVAQACRSAAEAQRAWDAAGGAARADVLRRAADLLQERSGDVAEWIMRESGAIAGKADNEVAGSIGELREAAALALQPVGEILTPPEPGRRSYAERVPIGVVGIITPWNFPLVLALRAVAPALALGNAVVLKPDPHTPVSGGMLIAQLLADAGLPDGVLHVLPGGAEAGEALTIHPAVGLICFTGSTKVGRLVGRLAGEHLKKVSLELGGNNALVVFEDADLTAASSAGSWGSFLHQGQICLTTGRHLVHERIADQYLELLGARARALTVGNPMDPDVALGPIINRRQLDHVDAIVRDTLAAGATAITGATHEDLFYQPTVLAGVRPEMRAFAEEIFGPVAPVTTFASEEEALALANDTDYGLTAAIHTTDVARGMRLARQMRTGMVHVNDATVNDAPNVPFGGMGSSGNGGRFGSVANREEFTQWQWTTVRDAAQPFPF
jgi:benzaldehyde dehydrogenase (NAD)